MRGSFPPLNSAFLPGFSSEISIPPKHILPTLCFPQRGLLPSAKAAGGRFCRQKRREATLPRSAEHCSASHWRVMREKLPLALGPSPHTHIRLRRRGWRPRQPGAANCPSQPVRANPHPASQRTSLRGGEADAAIRFPRAPVFPPPLTPANPHPARSPLP